MKILVLLYCCLLMLAGQLCVFANPTHPADEVKATSLLNQTSKASLTIQANVYFGDEDEETFPIAETDFYLLDESLAEIKL